MKNDDDLYSNHLKFNMLKYFPSKEVWQVRKEQWTFTKKA